MIFIHCYHMAAIIIIKMKVKVLSIVLNALRMIPKILEKRLRELKIRGRTEIIQTTALLKSARIIRRVTEI